MAALHEHLDAVATSARRCGSNLTVALALVEQARRGADESRPSVGPQRCDYLAAHPADPEKPAGVSGVEDSAIDSPEKVEQAIDACLAAIEAYPEESRFEFELGRVLVLAGMKEEGREFLAAAAELNHGGACYYLGRMEEDPARASEFYERAAEAGFAPGAAALAEDEPSTPPVAGKTAEEPVGAATAPAAPALPLRLFRVAPLTWAALGNWGQVPEETRRGVALTINDYAERGIKVLACSYGDPATSDWETYYFWYRDAPAGLRDYVQDNPQHPLRALGFKGVTEAPANSDLARRLRQEVLTAP